MNLIRFKKIIFLLLLFLFVSGCGQSDFNDGVRYQQEGEYDKAISSYNKAVKKNQNIALSQKNLGDIYILKNDCKKGFECYISSIEANHNLVLGYILKFISDSNKTLRQTALESLPKVQNQEAREKMLDKLSIMLKSTKIHEKIDALDLIASLGCTSEPLFEDILNLLKDDNPIVRQKALVAMPLLKDCVVEFNALGQIINVAQTDTNELVKISAIDCLGNLKYDARAALPILFDMVEADNSFSPLASKAIDGIYRSDKPNVKGLKKYLFSSKNSIKIQVLNILGNTEQNANDMVPFIIPMLKDDNLEIRELARATLRKIGTSSKEAVPDLVLLLKSPEYEIRLMALTELADIGKDASSSIPSIELLLKDSNENVRKYAEYAISEINK
ncbi:MAG: hypothetical protein PHR82_03580 [Endomicrobiaceae bacterium]|nr:hypothetical protein [Endomicrobiaceae bacterium]